MASSTTNRLDDSPQSRSAFARFFQNPDTGKLAVVQMPNIPLAIFLVAVAARLVFKPHGAVGVGVSIIAGVGLVVWALAEIVRGDSPFRRVLGGVVLVGYVVGLFLR